jgi:hypothetical protein
MSDLDLIVGAPRARARKLIPTQAKQFALTMLLRGLGRWRGLAKKIRARHGRRRDEFCAINTGA